MFHRLLWQIPFEIARFLCCRKIVLFLGAKASDLEPCGRNVSAPIGWWVVLMNKKGVRNKDYDRGKEK